MDYWKSLSDMTLSDLLNLQTLNKPRLDVYWEPTPYDIVNDMLRLAEIEKTDVVYDLGCGDGRIPIMAAQKTGARAIGIDLDPQRIKESVTAAREAGMDELVSFVNQDLFKMDISQATVLMLFLFPDVNMRLRPKILTELRASTRIVSYCHRMGEWEPDRTIKARRNHLYYWVMPENFSGLWEGSAESRPVRFHVTQEFQRFDATMWLNGDEIALNGVVVKGDRFDLTTVMGSQGRTVPVRIAGVIKGEGLCGELRKPASSEKPIRWAATRHPSTIVPLAK